MLQLPKVTLNAGGTLQLNLAELNVTSLSSTALKTFKESLVAEGFKGSFNFGEGFKVDLSDNEELQTAIESGEVSYSELASGGVNDVQGVADGVTVTVTDTEATNGINLSNGASAVKLASGTTSVAVDGTLALNGNGSNFVYAENTPDTPAAVSVKANSGVNLTGEGTVGDLTKAQSATNTTAVLTAGAGATQNVQGEINLDEVTIGAGTVNVRDTVTAGELSVNGTLTVSGGEGMVTVTGDSGAEIAGTLQATGSVFAESINLGASQNLSVGDSSSSGLVEVETLNLNNGMLLIDPAWTENASIVTVTGANTDDVIDVGGSIGVGQGLI